MRWALTAGARRSWLCFLFVPLAAVFVQAFADGARAYWRALVEPTALAALRLTAVTALVAVPAEHAVRPGRRLGASRGSSFPAAGC